jgi:hypothetical protein
MPTAFQIITRAMKICGALGQNETPTSSEAADGLTSLNDMLDSWNTDRTYIYTVDQNTVPVVNGQAVYTIGPSGDFNITRPVKIEGAFVRINGVDFPIKEINDQDYNSIPVKTNGGIPMYYYYDAAFPVGTLYLYPVPTEGDLYVDIWQQLTQFTDLYTDLSFPPGYNRALNYNLAQELAPEYPVDLPPQAVQIAAESLANIRNRNLPAPVMKTEVGALVGDVNWYGWPY